MRAREPATEALALVDRLSSPVLVGRGEQLGALVAAVVAPPAVVLLEGEAGVGKSRLIAELFVRPELARRRRLLGRCEPLREPFPLGPVVAALRSTALPASLTPLAGALAPLLPELADQLPPPPAALGDARAERHRLFRAITDVLRALGPTVCVLEDLHWADETTVEFLRFLVGMQLPELAVVWTYRREDLADPAALPGIAAHLPPGTLATRLTLAPLGPVEVGQLVATILDTEHVSDEFATYLHAKTGGLPFAVEEVVRLLQERRDLVRRDGQWARRAIDKCRVPDAVRDSVLARVHRLPKDARMVVRAAAVLRVPAPELALADVARLPVESAADALAHALRSGLLQESDGGVIGFRHELARQAVYEDLLGPERRRLHLAAAATLARQTPMPVARLAYHYEQAGRPAEWARYAEAAADVAEGLSDDIAVCRFLQSALAAPGLAPDARVRLARRLGNAALHALVHAEAVEVLRRILAEEPLEPGDRGELRRSLGVLLVQAGDASGGVGELRLAVPDLAERPAAATRAMMSLAVPWVVEGRVEEHLAWLERATATAVHLTDPLTRSAFLVDRATALLFLGDPAGWDAAAEIPEAATCVDESREWLRGYLNLAQAALYLGHDARAEELLATYRRVAEETSSVRLDGLAQTTRLLLDFHRGRWDDIADRAELLREDLASVPHATVDIDVVAALLAASRGDADAAARTLADVAGTARRCGSLPILAMAAGGLARLALDRGAPDEAWEATANAVGIIDGKGIWVWGGEVLPAAVVALLRCGRHAEAAELTGAFRRGLRGRDAPAAVAALTVCEAELAAADGDQQRAVKGMRRAEARWRQLGRAYGAARVRVRGLELAGQDASDADVAEALAELESLGAARDVAWARRTLRERGVSLPARWRGGRRGYGLQLSPREREIVSYAARGATNRDIAEALFLSPRTVEFHVAKAMRKLGVSSRRELATCAAAADRDHQPDSEVAKNP